MSVADGPWIAGAPSVSTSPVLSRAGAWRHAFGDDKLSGSQEGCDLGIPRAFRGAGAGEAGVVVFGLGASTSTPRGLRSTREVDPEGAAKHKGEGAEREVRQPGRRELGRRALRSRGAGGVRARRARAWLSLGAWPAATRAARRIEPTPGPDLALALRECQPSSYSGRRWQSTAESARSCYEGPAPVGTATTIGPGTRPRTHTESVSS